MLRPLGCDDVAGLVDEAEVQPCPAGARAAIGWWGLVCQLAAVSWTCTGNKSGC